ncbi:MAG: glycosyl hydrolase family 88 [Clostridia bacterium]|nr:glycosyl hydrolase family 88 [Clostridia bacterium]NLS86289.1 glycosyl hydrolase family 88 [Oscillospiraceae bacterium]
MEKQQIMDNLRAYIDYLLENSDAEHPMWNIEMVRSGKPNKWNYIDGCMITSVLALYRITGDEKYLSFADSFMGWFVNDDGSIKTYDAKEYNLDNVNPGKNLFALYDLTHKEKYRRAIDTVRAQLDGQPRINAGNFWHKDIYPNQVWLDGLYMAQPFYMEYETRFNKMMHCDDSFKQFENVRKFMRDEATGLYFHGYDESRKMYWADKETGRSPNFWLRALGWFVIALVDTLEAADEQMYYEYRRLQSMLREFIDALLPWQHESGMFYQLPALPQQEGNYLETSGTAIIAYGILKAVRLGFLPQKYKSFGEKAFFGTAEKYLSFNDKNEPQLGGICLVAGLGGADKRDGSIKYYLSEPIVKNEAKGVAPMLLAYTELI